MKKLTRSHLNRVGALAISFTSAFGCMYREGVYVSGAQEFKNDSILRIVPSDLREQVQFALNIAGQNRPELERAINHFYTQIDKSPRGAQKTQAQEQFRGVCFLVAESAYRFYASYPEGEKSNFGAKPKILPDPQNLKSEFLIAHLEQAYQTRNKYGWAKEVNNELFYAGVIGYRAGRERLPSSKDETTESYLFNRERFDQLHLGVSFDDFHGKINEFNRRYKEAKDPAAKTKVMEDLIHYVNTDILVVSAGKKYAPRGPEDKFWFNAVTQGGRAGDRCRASTYILRALGIPAVEVGVPHWGDVDGNHGWIEITMPFATFSIDGPHANEKQAAKYYHAQGFESWKIKGNGERSAENIYGRAYGVVLKEKWGMAEDQYTKLARAQYRAALARGTVTESDLMYSLNRTTLNYGREVVGSHYYDPHTIKIQNPILKAGQTYYLAVFNENEFVPILPAAATGFNPSVTFSGISGANTLYAVVRVENKDGKEKTTIIGNPFTVDVEGKLVYFNYSQSSPTHEIKYPLEQGKNYMVYAYDGEKWIVADNVRGSSTAKETTITIRDNTLYFVRRLADVSLMAVEGGVTFNKLPGESAYEGYDIFKLNKRTGEWEQIYLDPKKPAPFKAVNGEIFVAGLDVSETYSVEPSIWSGDRPFTYRNGKLFKFDENYNYR